MISARSAAVAAAALALAAAPAVAQAGTYHSDTAAAQCGNIVWGDSVGPPVLTSSYWSSNPCGNYQSPAEVTNAGTWGYGTWRTGVGSSYTSTADVANGTLARAYIRFKTSANGQRYCLKIYPSVGSAWFACDATPGS